MMYMHPNSKLINAHINENKAVYRFAKWSEWPYARTGLDKKGSKYKSKVTYVKSRTEIMLKVFHSRITESIKNSQVDVSLLYTGGTLEDSKAISISYS